MSSTFGRIGLSCLAICAVTAELAAQQTPNFEMRIVAKNGVPIVPFVTTLVAAPGDSIDVEVYMSEWSPSGQALFAWQWVFDPASAISGIRGAVRPKQGRRACDPARFDCFGYVGPGSVCLDEMFCNTNPLQFAAGVKIDSTRVDRIFCQDAAGIPLCRSQLGPFIDVTTDGVRVATSLSFEMDAQTYGPLPANVQTPRYAGELNLIVSPDACGTFSLGFKAGATLMTPAIVGQSIAPLDLRGITIEGPGVGECTCTRIVSDPILNELVSLPRPCAIDAGQPSQPDGTMPTGWQSLALKFDCPSTTAIALGLETFLPREVPQDFLPPQIDSIIADQPEPGWLTINFRRPIALEKWTCVEYTLSRQEVCIGSLPADVNASQISTVDDIMAAVDCLVGTATCDLSQCDVDRSGSCAQGDVLRVIDLLNGADSFTVFNGARLPPLFGCLAP